MVVFAAHATELGSGRVWHTLYASGRDGDGPPNVTLQLAWPADGSAGFQASVFEDGQRSTLVSTARWKEDIRFRTLEVHHYPSNDYWEEGGQTYKRFPKLLFVGHGTERGKPVTLVWKLSDEIHRRPQLLLKTFNADASRLDQPFHGSKRPGGFLVERAHAEWVPKAQRPSGVHSSDRLRRIWTYDAASGFKASSWK